MPCTTILIGKKASFDGSTIISRTDDGPYEQKRTVVVERNKAPRKYKCVDSGAVVDLPDFSYRYTCHPNIPSLAKKVGRWPAAGINEYGVGMSATETITSNPLVDGADPLVEKKTVKGKKIPGGIGESDFVDIVLPYIKSAREGVIRLGSLIKQYGTDERNGIAFNDKDEIWWFETIGGHNFVARKVPDDRVVIMPNQFGLDNFDFDDAMGEQKENICSEGLYDFVKKYNLDLSFGKFNPRLAFGSHSDQDHMYNTPRAWFILKYFAPNQYKFEGDNADFTPLSDNIPWSFVPDHKVTLQEIKYVLSSFYQGTKYNPYGKDPEHGKYRSIGVPNSDDTGIEQIRNNVPSEIAGIEWASFGGGAFTCCFPIYTNVTKIPDYIGHSTEMPNTDNMYWTSRLIAALTDANFAKSVIFTERYQLVVFNKAYQILNEYDQKFIETKDLKLLEEANEKIVKMVKTESEKTLNSVLRIASDNMKTRFNRNDN